jgi:D-amino peptidase
MNPGDRLNQKYLEVEFFDGKADLLKILISCDMEGITGVTSWDHVDPFKEEYQRFRHIMTWDANSAIDGAFEGGADEVVVTDGHWNGLNILIEELDKRVKLNSGIGTSQFSMMQGIDDSFDGVFFVGYHARACSESGILDHTWSTNFNNVWLNGILVGEYGLNAALAGSFGVPAVMISGDQTACRQARELLGNLETAEVKNASGRHSALCLTPVESQELIRRTSIKAMENLRKGVAPKPYVVGTPVQITIELISSDMADRVGRLPDSQRVGNKISITSPDMAIAYTAFRAAAGLASLS